MPHEFAISGIYLPPLFIASTLGLLATCATARYLNRHALANCFFYPPIVFLALMAIYTVLIGTLIIKV